MAESYLLPKGVIYEGAIYKGIGLGDTVWFMKNNKPKDTIVTVIMLCDTPTVPYVSFGTSEESVLYSAELYYKTKQELLDSL